MKLFSIIIFATWFLTNYQFHVTHRNQTREWYAQKVDKKNSNYIELITNGKSISGFFYGVERLPDRTLLFYKSTLDSVEAKGRYLRFSLDTFLFSRQPFERGMPKTFISPEDPSIPFVCRSRNYYFGNRNSIELRLQKTLDAYNNRADQAVFKKVTGTD
jgi:hypothetical protein